MRTLYIDANMGAAGDMLTAALLELTENPEESLKKLNNLQIPEVKYEIEQKTGKNITGTYIKVKVFDDLEEECAPSGANKEEIEHIHHENHHNHDGNDGHSHHFDHIHRHLSDILAIIDGINAENLIKNDAKQVYELLAKAESIAHKCEIGEIHFHEVGTMDAIADILAVCYLIREINPDKILVSPINVGNGQVKCAHGILPVPAPATANLLVDIPHYKDADGVMKELCTPTGAALLGYFADEFVDFGRDFGKKSFARIGHGMGTRVIEQKANCVTAYLEETNDR